MAICLKVLGRYDEALAMNRRARLGYQDLPIVFEELLIELDRGAAWNTELGSLKEEALALRLEILALSLAKGTTVFGYNYPWASFVNIANIYYRLSDFHKSPGWIHFLRSVALNIMKLDIILDCFHSPENGPMTAIGNETIQNPFAQEVRVLATEGRSDMFETCFCSMGRFAYWTDPSNCYILEIPSKMRCPAVYNMTQLLDTKQVLIERVEVYKTVEHAIAKFSNLSVEECLLRAEGTFQNLLRRNNLVSMHHLRQWPPTDPYETLTHYVL